MGVATPCARKMLLTILVAPRTANGSSKVSCQSFAKVLLVKLISRHHGRRSCLSLLLQQPQVLMGGEAAS